MQHEWRKKGSRWPPDKQRRLRAYDEQGMSIREMARRFDCSVGTIKRQREHLGVPPRTPPIPQQPREPRPERAPRPRPGASTLPPLPSERGCT